MADDKTEGFNWKEFSRKTWVIVVSGILLPPIGIILSWLKPEWSQKTKWIATGLIGLVLIGRLNSRTDEKSNEIGSTSPISSAIDSPTVQNQSQQEELDLMLLLKVRLGMSQSEVKSILGTPHEVNKVDMDAFPFIDKEIETWTYNPETDSWAVLGFENGVLTDGGSGGYDITSSGGAGGLKIDKIIPKEALKILAN